jgi:hypothetical protein
LFRRSKLTLSCSAEGKKEVEGPEQEAVFTSSIFVELYKHLHSPIRLRSIVSNLPFTEVNDHVALGN